MNIGNLSIFCAAIFALILVRVEAKNGKLDLKDADLDNLSVESLAELVCDSSSVQGQINRLSTILKLADFLEANPSRCNPETANVVMHLRRMIDSGKSNVCSRDLVQMATNFHNRYLSSSGVFAKQISKPLSLFYKHLMMEVSATCKRILVASVENELATKFSEEQFQFGGKGILDLLVKSFKEHLGEVDSVNDFDDVVMVWQFVRKNFIARFANSMRRYLDLDALDQETGQPIISVKMKDPKAFEYLQLHCRNSFRPVYSKLTLPILQLARLGFSAKSELLGEVEASYRNNPQVVRWFQITQICESILPIRVFRDESLDQTSTVVLNRPEADELISSRQVEEADLSRLHIPVVEFELQANNKLQSDKLASVELLCEQQLKECIKRTKEAGSNLTARMLKLSAKRIKKYLQEKAHRLFVWSRKSSSPKVVDLNMSASPESLSDDQLLEKVGVNPHPDDKDAASLARRKRNTANEVDEEAGPVETVVEGIIIIVFSPVLLVLAAIAAIVAGIFAAFDAGLKVLFEDYSHLNGRH